MKKEKQTICKAHEPNFNFLQLAFTTDNVCMLEAINNQTHEKEALVCAINRDDDGKEFSFVPYARMINGNPYDMFTPASDEERYRILSEHVGVPDGKLVTIEQLKEQVKNLTGQLNAKDEQVVRLMNERHQARVDMVFHKRLSERRRQLIVVLSCSLFMLITSCIIYSIIK